MLDSLLFQITLIVFLGILSQWLAWRFNIPAIVIMSFAGLLVGPFLGLIDPSQSFGAIFNPLISLAVAIILFEGSLSLDFREIKGFRKPIFRISTIGAFVAWIAGSLAAHYVAGLSLQVAFVIGGLFIVTGPTVILPLLRQAKLKERPASILKWEGIVVDPFGALLALFAFNVVLFIDAQTTGVALLEFFAAALFAVMLGLGIGFSLGILLERGFVPEYLKSPVVFAFVLVAFGISDAVMHETGLLAVTAMGMIMANMHLSSIRDMRHFKENVSVLLISSVFVMLTASLSLDTLKSILDIRMLLFVLAMMFIVRPLSIFIATINTGVPLNEKILLGWIAPRGIVALTVSGYFATVLVDAGYEDGQVLTALTLALVFATVLAHGFSISWLADKLGLTATKESGVLIIGGSPFAAALAQELQELNKPVLIMDRNWQDLRDARRTGIPSLAGDVLSEQTEYSVDLSPYEKMIAATTDDSYNALICASFVPDLGRENLYQTTMHMNDPQNYRKSLGGKMLFEPTQDIHKLNDLLEQGFVMRRTSITDKYTYNQFMRSKAPDSIPLFVVREEGDISFFVNGKVRNVESGATIVSLVSPAVKEARVQERLEQERRKQATSKD